MDLNHPVYHPVRFFISVSGYAGRYQANKQTAGQTLDPTNTAFRPFVHNILSVLGVRSVHDLALSETSKKCHLHALGILKLSNRRCVWTAYFLGNHLLTEQEGIGSAEKDRTAAQYF